MYLQLLKLKSFPVKHRGCDSNLPESSDSSNNGDEKEEFHITLIKQELNNLPRKSKLIVLGDLNGKIGKERWINWPNNVGKFVAGMINENGEMLLQFCSINCLGIMNTMYKHSPKCLSIHGPFPMEKSKFRSILLLFQIIKEVPSKTVGYTSLLISAPTIHYLWLNIS